MTTNEQIKELNETVKCRLGASKIHGVGVFSIRDIKKGEKMFCLGRDDEEWYDVPYSRFDEINEAIRNLILDRWPRVIEGSLFQSPNDDARLISFMNYSENPNYTHDTALQDIKAGEEVTENYPEFAKQRLNML